MERPLPAAKDTNSTPEVIKGLKMAFFVVLFAIPEFPVHVSTACVPAPRHTTQVIQVSVSLKQSA